MKLINIKNLTKVYHTKSDEIKSIDNISFDVFDNEFLTIIGPSGCGKSTLLNILVNIEKESDGIIRNNRNLIIGYMMQNDNLLEWLTVKENCLLGLKLKHIDTKENIDYAIDLINRYGLGEFINSYPDNLSGGMRQRVVCML